MGADEEIVLLKKQLEMLQAKLQALKEFTIEEIARTRVGMQRENKKTDKENMDKGMVY